MNHTSPSRSLRPATWLVAALLTALAPSCGSDDSPANDGTKTCSVGDTRQCVGPGACQGGQACAADGWTACDCTGGTGGSSGSGGAGVDASAGTSGGGASGGSGDSGTGGSTSKCPQGRGPVMVDLGTFCIDSTEVTQKQYQEFVDDVKGVVPSQSADCSWNTELVPPAPCTTGDNHPVVCRDWCDAQTYCKWAGKHLCGKIGGGPVASDKFGTASESEWVYACTQGGTTKYSWGDNAAPGMCLCSGCNKDVASKPTCRGNAPPYDGVYDLIGGAAEWVDSCYQGVCWIAGGASASKLNACAVPTVYADPKNSNTGTGFRCCADYVAIGGDL